MVYECNFWQDRALGSYQTITNQTMIIFIPKITNSIERNNMSHFRKQMIIINHDYYNVWDDGQTPIIPYTGKYISENWYDVLAMTFHTCFIHCKTKQGFLIDTSHHVAYDN